MIDWIAAFIGFYGTLLLRKKKKNGFLWLVVMSVLWCIIGFQVMKYGLIFSSLGFIFLNLLGYLEWRKDNEKKEKEKKSF